MSPEQTASPPGLPALVTDPQGSGFRSGEIRSFTRMDRGNERKPHSRGSRVVGTVARRRGAVSKLPAGGVSVTRVNCFAPDGLDGHGGNGSIDVLGSGWCVWSLTPHQTLHPSVSVRTATPGIPALSSWLQTKEASKPQE